MSKKTSKDLGRVVFARVGWMRRDAGPVPGDERPVGVIGFLVVGVPAPPAMEVNLRHGFFLRRR